MTSSWIGEGDGRVVVAMDVGRGVAGGRAGNGGEGGARRGLVGTAVAGVALASLSE